jgi:hypothetical protein
MSHAFREIKGFLDVTRYEGAAPRHRQAPGGAYPFITISREYGAGGRRLARALLEAMESQPSRLFRDWRIFDRQLCESLVDDAEIRGSFEALFSEEYHSEIESLVHTFLGSRSDQALAATRLFHAIRTVASRGKTIIVGRAGCCVTSSLQQGVHLRLVAPESHRIRQMGLDGLERADARRELKRHDRDRARLVQVYFHRDIADPTLYDAVWNTARVQLGVVASSTLTLVARRAGVESPRIVRAD